MLEGRVFVEWKQQDSGCVSYGIESDGERLFVKTAREPRAIESLRRAQRLHERVKHPALPRLRNVLEAESGPVLVYDFVDGECLYRNPRSHEIPVHVLDVAFDVLLGVAEHGFVGVDWYDGCLIHDFERGATHVCDLDEFREGPFVLEAARLPGSTRFMAPEESVRGSLIDQTTNVFTYARTAAVLLGDRLQGELAAVIERATQPERARRFEPVRDFVDAWRAARR